MAFKLGPKRQEKLLKAAERYIKNVNKIISQSKGRDRDILLRTLPDINYSELMGSITSRTKYESALRRFERYNKNPKAQSEIIIFRDVPITRFSRQNILNWEQSENYARRKLNAIRERIEHQKGHQLTESYESDIELNKNTFRVSGETLQGPWAYRQIEKSLLGTASSDERSFRLRDNIIKAMCKSLPDDVIDEFELKTASMSGEEFYEFYLRNIDYLNIKEFIYDERLETSKKVTMIGRLRY